MADPKKAHTGWHVTFTVMAALAPVLGILTAGVTLAAFSPSQVPFFSDRMADMVEAEFLLAVIVSLSALLFWTLLAWLVSLSPHQTRRPRKSLCLLGTGVGCLGGTAAWLGMNAIGFEGTTEPGAAFIAGLIITTPLILLPDFLCALVARSFASVAARSKKWGMAAFFLRLLKRFAPNDKDLPRQLGLADFHRGAYADALSRLLPYFQENPEDLPPRMLAALHESATQLEQTDLIIQSGERLLREMEDAPATSPVIMRIRERLRDIYLKREQWADAKRMFEPIIDKSNPSDLEILGEILLNLNDLDSVKQLLPDLELTEAPPRFRTEKVYNSVMANLSEESLSIGVMYADYMLRQKRQNEETTILENILEVKPSETEVRERLIQIYRQTVLAEKLIEHLSYMIDQEGSSNELRVELVDLLMSSGQFKEADEQAAEAIEQTQDDYRFYYARASCALRAKEFEAARQFCDEAEQALGEEPSNEAAEAIKSLRRKIDRATEKSELAELEEFCRDNPDDMQKNLEFIGRLLKAKKVEKATMELEALISKNPNAKNEVEKYLDDAAGDENPPYMLLHYLADLKISLGKLDRAHELYGQMAQIAMEPEVTLKDGAERILEKDDKHILSLLRIYELNREDKSWPQADEYLSRALDAGHKLETLEERMAAFETFVGHGNRERGLPLGKMLIEEESFNYKWFLLQAKLLARHDEFEEALAMLARAKELEPGNNVIFKTLDDVRRKQRERRIIDLRELIDKEPENADALAELGDLLVHFERFEEALRMFQRASQATEDDDQRRLTHTKLAGVMLNRRMYDTSLETLREVPLSLMENKAALQDRKRIFYEVAEEFESNNRLEDALELYKQVFKVDAGFRRVMEKMEKLSV
jgi:tetratricopeptide (TPR) repeat protein